MYALQQTKEKNTLCTPVIPRKTYKSEVIMLFGVGACILLLVIHMKAVADQLPRLGKKELICLLSFTCNHVVLVWRDFLFLLVLGMGCILLWHSLGLPYNYFEGIYVI